MTSATEPATVPRPARQGLSLSHILLVAVYSVRFTVRTGGGLVFLFLFILAGMIVAGICIDPVDTMIRNPDFSQGRELTSGELIEEVLTSQAVADVVGWVTGSDEEQTHYLLRDNPALLSAIFLIYLILIPFLACVGAFNQTAGDIGSRGLRYLLLRTERPNIFIGRFFGVVLASTIAAFFVMLVVVFYMHLKLRIYPFGDLASWGAQGFLAILILALPYIALSAWISGSMSSAFGSLAVSLVATGVPVLLLAMVNGMLTGMADIKVDWLTRILPWGWKYDLLDGDAVTRLTAIGVMLGFTAVFFLLGFWRFSRRDL